MAERFIAPFNRSLSLSLDLDLGGASMLLPPPSHRGGGQDEERLEGSVVGNSMEGKSGADVLSCAYYMVNRFVAVILGHKGDPSSTSSPKALEFICWSSTPLEGQVVRPWPSSGCPQLYTPEKSFRAYCSLSSAETPGARRRLVAEAVPLIAFFLLYFKGAFCKM
jgi:hypothetical protein